MSGGAGLRNILEFDPLISRLFDKKIQVRFPKSNSASRRVLYAIFLGYTDVQLLSEFFNSSYRATTAARQLLCRQLGYRTVTAAVYHSWELLQIAEHEAMEIRRFSRPKTEPCAGCGGQLLVAEYTERCAKCDKVICGKCEERWHAAVFCPDCAKDKKP